MMMVCDPCKLGIMADDETSMAGEMAALSKEAERFTLTHSHHGALRAVADADFLSGELARGYVDVQRPHQKPIMLPQGALPPDHDRLRPYGMPGTVDARGEMLRQRRTLSYLPERVGDTVRAVAPEPSPMIPDALIRPTWDTTFLDVARVLAQRGTCSRKQVGAVLVMDNRIVSTGYNGSPPGLRHCQHHLVPKGQHDPDMDGGHCAHAEHAERNALLYARRDVRGSTMYLTCSPCLTCCRMMATAGVTRIVYGEHYRVDRRVEELCASMSIDLVHYEIAVGGPV